MNLENTETLSVLEYSVTNVDGTPKGKLVLSRSKSERVEMSVFEEVVKHVGKVGRKVVVFNNEILYYVKNIKAVEADKKAASEEKKDPVKSASHSRGTGCFHHPKNC